MRLLLDPNSGEPIWRQIVEQVKYRIATQDLKPGAQLPSIRSMGNELQINPRTVVRAYEELGHLGLVVTRQGQGVFVLNGEAREPASLTARTESLTNLSRRLVSEGARMGATREEMLGIFTKAIDELDSNNS